MNADAQMLPATDWGWRSETIGALAAALAAAQADFPAIAKAKTVAVRTDKGTYTFSYAPLEAILDATRPALAKNGLALTQLLTGQSIRTVLAHKTGEWISSDSPLPTYPARAQELGSLVTYLRRYAAVSILGVAAEDDDDGNIASGHSVAPASGAAKAPSSAGRQPAPPSEAPPAKDGAPTEKQVKYLEELIEAHPTPPKVRDALRERYGTDLVTDLTRSQVSDLIARLKQQQEKAA